MKRIIASLAAVAMVAGAAPALAGITPTGTTVTLTGDLFVKQLLSSNCSATFVLDVNSTGSAGSITNVDLGTGTVCGGITPNLPWAITWTGTGQGVIDVDATTSAGWCRGPLRVEMDSSGKVVIPSGSSNEVPGQIFGFLTENCVIYSLPPHLSSSPAINF